MDFSISTIGTALRLTAGIIFLGFLILGTWYSHTKLGRPIGTLLARNFGHFFEPPRAHDNVRNNDVAPQRRDTGREDHNETDGDRSEVQNRNVYSRSLDQTQSGLSTPMITTQERDLPSVFAGAVGVLIFCFLLVLEVVAHEKGMIAQDKKPTWTIWDVFAVLLKACVESIVTTGLLGGFVKVVVLR